MARGIQAPKQWHDAVSSVSAKGIAHFDGVSGAAAVQSKEGVWLWRGIGLESSQPPIEQATLPEAFAEPFHCCASNELILAAFRDGTLVCLSTSDLWQRATLRGRLQACECASPDASSLRAVLGTEAGEVWVADCTPSESGLPAISPFLLETVGGSDGSGKRNRPGVWATFESAKQLAFDYFRQPGRAQSDAVPRSISLSADFGMAAVLRKDSLTVMPIMGRGEKRIADLHSLFPKHQGRSIEVLAVCYDKEYEGSKAVVLLSCEQHGSMISRYLLHWLDSDLNARASAEIGVPLGLPSSLNGDNQTAIRLVVSGGEIAILAKRLHSSLSAESALLLWNRERGHAEIAPLSDSNEGDVLDICPMWSAKESRNRLTLLSGQGVGLAFGQRSISTASQQPRQQSTLRASQWLEESMAAFDPSRPDYRVRPVPAGIDNERLEEHSVMWSCHIADSLPKRYGSATLEGELEAKRERHSKLATFLYLSGAWERISPSGREQILEHGERLAASHALRRAQNAAMEDSHVDDSALSETIHKAGMELRQAASNNLGERDATLVFFSKCTEAADAFFRHIELHCSDASDADMRILSEAVTEMLYEAEKQREAVSVAQHAPAKPIFIHWTASACRHREPARRAFNALCERSAHRLHGSGADHQVIHVLFLSAKALFGAQLSAIQALNWGTQERQVLLVYYKKSVEEYMRILLHSLRSTVGSSITEEEVLSVARAHRAYEVVYEMHGGHLERLYEEMERLRGDYALDDKGFSQYCFDRLLENHQQPRAAEVLRTIPPSLNEDLHHYCVEAGRQDLQWCLNLSQRWYNEAGKAIMERVIPNMGRDSEQRKRMASIAKLCGVISGSTNEAAEGFLHELEADWQGGADDPLNGSEELEVLGEDVASSDKKRLKRCFRKFGKSVQQCQNRRELLLSLWRNAARVDDWQEIACQKGRLSDGEYANLLKETALYYGFMVLYREPYFTSVLPSIESVLGVVSEEVEEMAMESVEDARTLAVPQTEGEL